MTTLIILDTETAGLKPPASGSGLVEFAYLIVDPQSLVIQYEFVSRINPGCDIDPGAQAVHGISAEDVADAPTLHSRMLPFDDVLAVGHNVAFDLRFLTPTFTQIKRNICTLTLARRHVKGVLNHKLTTLAAHFKLPEQQAHSALGDCYYVLGLLRELTNITGKTVLKLEDRSNSAAVFHQMPFGKYKGRPLHQVPTDYLEWFSKQDIEGDLKKTIEIHLKVR